MVLYVCAMVAMSNKESGFRGTLGHSYYIQGSQQSHKLPTLSSEGL